MIAPRWLALPIALLLTGAALPARAFCGFYVSGADAKLSNDATMVVMMREGTRTVLSMQNSYKGPPEQFAMVIPVPVVLQKENVKTLPPDIFARVDTLASPRLVEYWEQDPCPEPELFADNKEGGTGTRAKGEEGSMGSPRNTRPKVVVEAQFAVGEYEIVILSASEAGALDGWLRENGYKIPAGAEAVLRPYVQAGSKFFVAKVDVEKVVFDGESARLSPLRFHYDTDTFTLPIRLGLLNSNGTQDLLVHILAQRQRYEAANYENVVIPTNLEVSAAVRSRFGPFYAALFDRTLEKHPRAVVTEYAWGSGSCDPCPGPVLSDNDLRLLGGDVMGKIDTNSMVLTRLHARYGKESLGEDLVFRTAPGIAGGREGHRTDETKNGAEPSSTNTFQGRYIIRRPWMGPIECSSPQRGVWGGPPLGMKGAEPRAASDLGQVTRGGIQLASFLRSDVAELGVIAAAPPVDTNSRHAVGRLRIGFWLGAALGFLAVAITFLAERLRRPFS
ncbi:MAG: DUF2330 domain-containing protein [Minicystis sp.]